MPDANSFETIIIGAGAMGSAAAYQLSKKGHRVLVIDQFVPPHTFGSTHGDTRITRQAIGEGEEYVPLSLRSYEIWRELEERSGMKLLEITGGLLVGKASGQSLHGNAEFLQTTIDAARKFSIPHSILSADELRKQFPQFRIDEDDVGYFEDNAGFLRPERCVRVQIELAARQGAEIRFGENVQRVVPTAGGSVEVKTDQGVYRAGTVIVSAGPWITRLFPEFVGVFKVYRQVLYWFDLPERIAPFIAPKMPVFILTGNPEDSIYGFPAVDGRHGGLKAAFEDYDAETTPEEVRRDVSRAEIERAYARISGHLPALRKKCVKAVTCLYTVTPDSGFVIDTHPEYPQIIIASPCSGHGFKHSAAIGEALAEMATEGTSSFDVSAFGIGRFSRKNSD